MSSDVIYFERKVNDCTVQVSAHHMPRQELWALICKVNRVAVEHMSSDDPWRDAKGMIDKALIDNGPAGMDVVG